MDKKTLRKLRNRLPVGFREAAQNKLLNRGKHVSPQYVSQVISGSRRDLTVLEVLIEVAEDHEAKVAELKARARGEAIPA